MFICRLFMTPHVFFAFQLYDFIFHINKILKNHFMLSIIFNCL